MGLTIANWGNVSTNMATPNQGIASEDWAALGKGFGGLAKWAQTQKAAELMEGTKGVQGRINAIDAEIAQLEAQLQSIEEQNQADEAKAVEDAQVAERSLDAAGNMAGYVPSQQGGGRQPLDATEMTNDPYRDQYLATQAALGQVPNRAFPQTNLGLQSRLENAYIDQQHDLAQQAQRKYRWGR